MNSEVPLGPAEEKNDKRYCIYSHTNLINGKKYIGQTKHGDDPNRRWRRGNGYRDCEIFDRAIQKYGWDNFKHEILLDGLTQEEANAHEESYIKLYHTCVMDEDCWGYNLTYGGDNRSISDLTREKNRRISTELWKSDEYRTKACRGRKGRKASLETRQKLSEMRRGRILSDEHKRKLSERKIGKPFSEEHRKHLSENSAHSKKVRCLETNETFKSCTEAALAMSMSETSRTHISRACKSIESTAGRHPITGEKLHWEYVTEQEENS
jgi:group I intron endonuclease